MDTSAPPESRVFTDAEGIGGFLAELLKGGLYEQSALPVLTQTLSDDGWTVSGGVDGVLAPFFEGDGDLAAAVLRVAGEDRELRYLSRSGGRYYCFAASAEALERGDLSGAVFTEGKYLRRFEQQGCVEYWVTDDASLDFWTARISCGGSFAVIFSRPSGGVECGEAADAGEIWAELQAAVAEGRLESGYPLAVCTGDRVYSRPLSELAAALADVENGLALLKSPGEVCRYTCIVKRGGKYGVLGFSLDDTFLSSDEAVFYSDSARKRSVRLYDYLLDLEYSESGRAGRQLVPSATPALTPALIECALLGAALPPFGSPLRWFPS